MAKFTRRLRKHRKNRTLKTGGASEPREGTLDIIGDKLNNVIQNASATVIDTGLKIAGLERIHNKSDNSTDNSTINDNGVMSSVANKTGSAIINSVNEVLGSNTVKESTLQAAKDTADIIKQSASKFNEALNDPVVKSEVEEAIRNAGEISTVAVEAAREPFNEAVDVASDAFQKTSSAALSGAIKVGTDAMAAIPGIGSIIELGKIANDSSKAASAMVEAGSEAIEAASDAFIETKANMERGLKELEEKKRIGEQIANRTTRSITDFQNPKIGGQKSRRRLFKRKGKSKRVRFAF